MYYVSVPASWKAVVEYRSFVLFIHCDFDWPRVGDWQVTQDNAAHQPNPCMDAKRGELAQRSMHDYGFWVASFG
jgi:hypothetical protein